MRKALSLSSTLSKALVVCLLTYCGTLLGQSESSNPSGQTKGQVDIKVEITAIHQLTKTARAAKDFSAIIDRCHEALETDGLAEEDQNYLKAVSAWSYNRRCESRMETAEYLLNAGNEEQASKSSDDALSDAMRAIELDPTRWQAILNRGILLARAGLYEPALTDFQHVSGLQPDSSLAWYNAGESNNALHKYDEAVVCFGKALALDPGDLQSLTGRAHAFFALGKFEKSWADCDVVAKIMADNAAALINRGDSLQALGRWSDAYEDYDAAGKIADDGRVLSRTAWLLATCPESKYHRPDDAAELAQRAIQLDGQTTANLEALAAAEAARGEFDLAIKNQQRAVELTKDDASAAAKQRLEMYRQHLVFTQAEVTDRVSLDKHPAD